MGEYSFRLFNDSGMSVRADIYRNGRFLLQGVRFSGVTPAINWANQKIEQLTEEKVRPVPHDS